MSPIIKRTYHDHRKNKNCCNGCCSCGLKPQKNKQKENDSNINKSKNPNNSNVFNRLRSSINENRSVDIRRSSHKPMRESRNYTVTRLSHRPTGTFQTVSVAQEQPLKIRRVSVTRKTADQKIDSKSSAKTITFKTTENSIENRPDNSQQTIDNPQKHENTIKLYKYCSSSERNSLKLNETMKTSLNEMVANSQQVLKQKRNSKQETEASEYFNVFHNSKNSSRRTENEKENFSEYQYF